jgi:uncharacterized protein YjbI with pentapeptide repeats
MKRTCLSLIAILGAGLSLTAAAAPVVSFSDAVHQQPQFNGISLNGNRFNGARMNGSVLQGVTLNGPGIVLQGITLNGPGIVLQGVTLNGPGVVLQGAKLNGPGLILQGWELNGPALVIQGRTLNGDSQAGTTLAAAGRPSFGPDFGYQSDCVAPKPAGHSILSGLDLDRVQVRLAPR